MVFGQLFWNLKSNCAHTGLHTHSTHVLCGGRQTLENSENSETKPIWHESGGDIWRPYWIHGYT